MRGLGVRAWSIKKRRFLNIDTLYCANGKVCAVVDNGVVNDIEDVLLEQYTGLKDRNGREIYEGDIVKVCNKHVSSVYMHPSGEWVLPQFLDKEDKPIPSLLWHCDKEQAEVIGNIHENSELLKEEK